jgi:predicted acetyltransferase
MIRIINVYEALKLFAKKNQDTEFCFNVYDDVLKINTGTYKIKDGVCNKTSLTFLNNPDIINIEQLTGVFICFCKSQQRKYLYMNLMLN